MKFLKRVLLAASAAFFVSGVQAADVVPNHIRHPLHASAVKALAPKSVVRMGAVATASSAGSYVPLYANGGLSNTNTIAGLSWSALLGDTATYADNSVQQADIGATVAGLDGSGNVTSGVLSGKIVSGPTVAGSMVPTTYTYINPQSTDTVSGKGPFYWWDGPSQMRVGGTPITLPHNPYISAIGVPQAGTYQSLVLNGNPTGGYNGSCVLCLFMEPNDIKQAAVSAVNFSAGEIPTADGVGLYEGPVNAKFDLIIGAASYTATSVTLSDTLTATELSHIQPGMTIFTNSQIPGVTASSPEGEDYYMGVIASVSTSADNVTTITTYGWGQAGKTAAGAVPSTTSLESYFWANRTTPVVGIGGFNKAFARNVYMSYDGNYTGADGSNAASLVHSFTGEELDFNVVNETRNGAVSFAGYGVNINMSDKHTNVLTHGSSDFYAGGNAPHHFISGDSCYLDASGYYDQSAFEGLATWIGGACQLGALETALGRYDQEVAEFDGKSQNAQDMRLMYHIAEAVKGGGTSVTNIVSKLGLVIGGEHGAGVSIGTTQGDIEWNQGGYYGGISLCGYGTACGFVVDGSGVPHAAPFGFTGNGYTIGTQPSGHAAAFGLYAPSGYAANLMEIMDGTSTEATLSAGGNLTVAGNVTTGADAQIIIPAASTTGSGVGNYLTTDGNGALTVHAAGTKTAALNVGTIATTNSITSAGTITSTSGANGLIAGTQPSGHVANIGAYAASGSTTSLFEAMVGTSVEASLSAGGNLTVGGNLITGASGQIVIPSASTVGAGVGNYLTTDGYGNLTIHTSNGGASKLTAGRVVETATYTLSTLPAATQDGEHVWCSDCKLNSIAGVEAYWHAAAAKWTDSQNGTLVN